MQKIQKIMMSKSICLGLFYLVYKLGSLQTVMKNIILNIKWYCLNILNFGSHSP